MKRSGPSGRSSAFTDQVFELATNVLYQLSNGKRRSVSAFDCNLYDVFGSLVEEGEHFEEDAFILLQTEGYRRSLFINPNLVDYISIPTHIFEKNSDDASADLIDALQD